MESAFHAVPVVCVPMFGDQPYHCGRAQAAKKGVQVTGAKRSGAQFNAAIKEVLSNKIYAENNRKLSALIKSIDSDTRIDEFVTFVAISGYEYITPADDTFSFIKYWNLDFWLLLHIELMVLYYVAKAIFGKRN